MEQGGQIGRVQPEPGGELLHPDRAGVVFVGIGEDLPQAFDLFGGRGRAAAAFLLGKMLQQQGPDAVLCPEGCALAGLVPFGKAGIKSGHVIPQL